MYKFFVLLFTLFLFACDHFDNDKEIVTTQVKKDYKNVQNNVGKSTGRMADNVRDSIKRTGNKLHEWWVEPLPDTSHKNPMPPRYCYKVLQDILCYREQVVGWESKLVGYQGENAKPPSPSSTQLIPLRKVEKSSESSVEKRVAGAKPILSSIPQNIKDTTNPSSSSPLIDSQETLPNYPLSPQL